MSQLTDTQDVPPEPADEPASGAATGRILARHGQTLEGGRIARTPSLRLRSASPDARAVWLVAAVGAVSLLALSAFWIQDATSGCDGCTLERGLGWVLLVVPATGAAVGAWKLREAGAAAPPLIRATAACLCIDLAARALGDAVYEGFQAAGVELPYPSPADAPYIVAGLAWLAGLLLLHWALDTSVQEEIGEFAGILTAVWGLLVVGLTLITGDGGVPDEPGRLALNILYPFISAAACTLASALFFGRQLRRMTAAWRIAIALLWAASFTQFVADVAFALLSSFGTEDASWRQLAATGELLDASYALATFIASLALALLPLTSPVRPASPSER